MPKAGRTKALYAGSFDPITRGHLDIIGKALMTFDAVHVAIGTNVKKQRAFGVEESLRLIERSIVEHWPEAVANASELPSGDLLFEGALEMSGAFGRPATSTKSSGFTASPGASIRRYPWCILSAKPGSSTSRRARQRNWTLWVKALGGWSCRASRRRSPTGVADESSRRSKRT
jgi:cytidyltransferase-like protein